MAKRFFWVILVLTAFWRVYVSINLDLCFDEAYYYYWSLFPQLSYFDHPPLTAWAMWISGALLDSGKLTVRIWPLLGGLLLPLIGRALALRLYGERVGNLAGALLLLSPVFIANGFLMTPDTLFAPAWGCAVYTTWMALHGSSLLGSSESGSDDRPTDNTSISRWWILVGLVAGVGFLCKYNMVIYFLSLGFLLLIAPRWRNQIFWGGLVAGLIAFVIFLPVVIWNAENDWVSFRFQLSHGFSGSRYSMLKTIGNYLGGLLIIVTPLFSVLSFKFCYPALFSKDERQVFLSAFFWPMIVFFGYSSLKSWVQPNWPMMAFFTGLILLASQWTTLKPMIRRLTLGTAIAVDVLVMAYFALPRDLPVVVLGKQLDTPRMREFHGAQEIADVVRKAQSETGARAVMAKSHQLFGLLAFYAPELQELLVSPWDCLRGERPRFPWIKDEKWTGQDVLMVNLGAWADTDMASFEKVDFLTEVKVGYRPNLYNEVFLYMGHNFRP